MGKRKEITETLEGEDERRNGRSEDSELEDGEKSGFFACYLLTSLCPRFKGHTYIGFTVNPRRRIRQHNGEICSGASRTKKKRPWEMVLCIYGFPTNVAALQFEWAWQHPVESLAVRKAAVGFKSLGGLANKIKLAYTMLTLPAWNTLKLNVNFFSTKYTKHYAGCPSLPSHMRVHVRSMDELPCYTEGYTEGEDDMFRFKNHSWDDDDDEPDMVIGSEATFTDVTIPNLVSEETTCVLDNELPSCSNNSSRWSFNSTLERSTVDLSSVLSATIEDENAKMDIEGHERPFCSNNSPGWSFNDTMERSTIDLSSVVPETTEDENPKMDGGTGSWSGVAIDIEGHERQSCSNNSPGWSFNDTLERSTIDLSSVGPETNYPKMDGGMGSWSGMAIDIDGPGGEVEVIDLFTPSPELRTKSRRTKSRISVVNPEIIDLTQSPIYV